MKKLISLCMCIVLCIGVLPINAIAEGKENEVAVVPEITTEVLAEDLKTLGLFKGVSDTDFALERKPTRTEALVMLIRVLGQEQAALDGTWEHPFTDVASWANAYVGYAYSTGLTNGISATEFGSSNIAPDYMYLTFVLRALGYSDANGDFTWNDPYALASDAGILPKEYDKANFLRGDVVNISYAALNALMKNSQKTLANTLIEKNAFTAEKFSSVYRLGAVKLDIDPFTEIRKMIKQYGEYDEKNDTYSFVVFEDIRTDGHWENYVNKKTFSYAESDGSVTLRNDVITHYVSYDGGTRSELKGLSYYVLRMTEDSDIYEVDGYDKTIFVTSGGDIEEQAGSGVLYPEKWTGNYSDDPYWEDGMKHYHGWMDYTFTKRVYPWVGFVDSFASSISSLIHSLDDEMEKYGLTNGREEFGFTVVIAPPTILSEMLYESTISDKEINRLRKYDITTTDEYTSYSEAKYKDKLDQYSMQDSYSGRTADFKNLQEAHDYLSTAFSDSTYFKSVKLGLNGYSDSLEVYLNLLMAEAASEMSYVSGNLEIKFHTDEDLVYHPDDRDSIYIVVRGMCELIIKNHNSTEWTFDDYNALKKTFGHEPHYYSSDLAYLVASDNLPQYVDVDVHLGRFELIDVLDPALKTALGTISIQMLNDDVHSKITAHSVENGQVRVTGIGASIEVQHDDPPVSDFFSNTDVPVVVSRPDPGYWISDLIINGESVGAHFYYPIAVTGDDITVKAVFEEIKDPVKITLTVLGDAPVIRIYVGELCLESHPYKDKSVEVIVPRGTEIRVNIYSSLVGKLGHHITDVTMNGEVYETQDNYIIVVNEDLTISANSKQN